MFLKVFPHLAEQRAMFWASSWKIFVVSLKPDSPHWCGCSETILLIRMILIRFGLQSLVVKLVFFHISQSFYPPLSGA